MFPEFKNRQQAGRELAKSLMDYADRDDAIVLALPRGGVPVAFEVARTLHVPMDVLLVRKLGVPGHKELAMGAIALGNVCVMNDDIVQQLGIAEPDIKSVLSAEKRELDRRNQLYRQGRAAPALAGKMVIVVDDGLATGATMMAAITALREMEAGQVIAAVPVGAASTCRQLTRKADRLVCLQMPEPFYGVGQWYRDFSQTSDQEVLQLLGQANVAEPPADKS